MEFASYTYRFPFKCGNPSTRAPLRRELIVEHRISALGLLLRRLVRHIVSPVEEGFEGLKDHALAPNDSRLLRRSGVCAAVDGQIRPGDVGRFRAGHERYQRGDFVNRSVAVEGGIGFLGRGPIARGGI
jgi:hypothetical protein